MINNIEIVMDIETLEIFDVIEDGQETEKCGSEELTHKEKVDEAQNVLYSRTNSASGEKIRAVIKRILAHHIAKNLDSS